MISSVAVIGAGLMGGGIARNLAGSFKVTVYDVNEERVRRCVAVGATPSTSIRDAISGSDLVITSLPLPETVRAVVSENIAAAKAGALWMDVSTIDPGTALELEELLGASGLGFVACPLGKGPAQAEAGTLPLFVGCREELLGELSAIFDCIGERVHYLGSVQAATTFKIASNMIGMSNLAALAEGYALCRRCDVDEVAFAEALQSTGAWSNQADLRLGMMRQRDFDARFTVDLALKDVRLAVDVAARRGVPAPVGAAGLNQLVSAHRHGWGRSDAAALFKLIEPDREFSQVRGAATDR